MDLWSFLIGLGSPLAVVCVGIIAFRRRRRRGSPMIMNPRTRVVEPTLDYTGRLPEVPPMPPTTTSQTTY